MKNKKIKPAPEQKKIVGISRLGKRVILAGVAVLIAGYFVLAKTDPMGQNWASRLSPFLILGGYALIGLGIVVPDAREGDTTNS